MVVDSIPYLALEVGQVETYALGLLERLAISLEKQSTNEMMLKGNLETSKCLWKNS